VAGSPWRPTVTSFTDYLIRFLLIAAAVTTLYTLSVKIWWRRGKKFLEP
jgi:hypothetical protein